MKLLFRYIFYIRININKILIPFLVKFEMLNLLSLLLIFNLSKIKKIPPKKSVKYRILVLSKSAGIDDLIESQKKYNNNILYLEFPRYFLQIIYETILGKYHTLSDEKYYSKSKDVENLKEKYRNFLIIFFKIFIKKYSFNSFIGFNFIYKAERELHVASKELNVPFLVLFKESVLTKSQKKFYSYAYQKNNEKFKGYKIGVYSNFAKEYLIKSKIVNKKRVEVIGCSRLSISYSYKKIIPKNQIVYYAIEKYRGLPNIYYEIFGKKFFKDFKYNNLFNTKYNWEKLHIKTLEILKKFANNNSQIPIIIKTKTGEKYNKDDFINLPKNMKVYKDGVGHGFLKESKVIIGWNSTSILEGIAANRFILLPYFHKKNKFLKESELKLNLKKENYGFSENDFYKKLNNLMRRKYKKNKKYNSLGSLNYYLGNSNNDAELKLNNFIINNLNYKNTL